MKRQWQGGCDSRPGRPVDLVDLHGAQGKGELLPLLTEWLVHLTYSIAFNNDAQRQHLVACIRKDEIHTALRLNLQFLTAPINETTGEWVASGDDQGIVRVWGAENHILKNEVRCCAVGGATALVTFICVLLCVAP
jgi:hypothetical protein